jgi:putative SOS response-associated peptidase YedK
MCGRYILAQSAMTEKAFGVTRPRWLDASSYNVAPARDVPVIRVAAGEREGVMMRWGLIPPFLKGESPRYDTSNARMETMETAPAFREPWKQGRRCVVPAAGFYEWHQPVGRPRQPWFVGLANKAIVPFAGLWDRSKRADGVTIESFAIITMPANDFLAKIDNVDRRMPAILRAEEIETWLTGTSGQARAALIQFPGEQLHAHRVSPRVNSPRNDDPALIEELSGAG